MAFPIMFWVVYFNDTATPAISTYGHPLSLHVALPSFDPRRPERGAERVVFLRRHVDADHAIDPGIARGGGEPVRPAAQHRIGIAHQDERDMRMARAETTSDGEDAGGGRAGGEATQVRGLGHGAGVHRIGEGEGAFAPLR